MADNNQPVNSNTTDQNNDQISQTNEMKEKTAEQFDKLLEHNKSLYEENRKKIEENERLKRELDQINSSKTQTEPDDNLKSIADLVKVDEKTGEKYLDPIGLAKRIEDLTKKAELPVKELEEYKKTQTTTEIEREKADAFKAYPELNPRDSKFDKEFMRKVRMAMQDSVRFSDDYGGRPLSLRDAADWVREQDGGKKEPKTETTDKKEITTEPNTQKKAESSQEMDADQLMFLRDQTRRGSLDALISRLESIKDTYTEKVSE